MTKGYAEPTGTLSSTYVKEEKGLTQRYFSWESN